MRVRPGNFPGLRSRPQLRATLLILSLLLLQLVHRANAQTQIPSHGPSSPGQQQIVRDRQEVTELELGKPVEREIAGGQPHSYRIDLAAGQYVKVKIDQRGIDVVVRLFGPDGKAISEVDNESRTVGEEIVELVAGAGGVSKIEIVPKYKSLPAGRYEIRLVEVRAATASDRLLDEAHKLVTQSREFERTEKYDDALSLAERSLEITEKELGPNNPYVGYLLDVVGNLHLLKGSYAKAEVSFQRGLAINQSARGLEHPETIRSMRGLGLTYGHLQEFQKGEELLQQALELTEKIFGVDHPSFAQCLFAIGTLHLHRSDLTRSEQELQRAIAIGEKHLGVDSVWLEMPLNNLGNLYNSRKEFDRAEPLLQRALEIGERKVGPDSPELAMPLQNLGLIAQEQRKDYPRALELYWRAVRVLEKGVGPESPRIAAILNNVANIYKSQGDFAKALELHQRVYSMMEKALGPHHRFTLNSLGNIARTYASMGDVANAIKFQMRTDEVIEKNLVLNLAIGSERQKLAYLDSLSERTDRTISLHVNLAPSDSTARDLAALVILQRKGRVLDAMSASLSALRRRLNSENQKLLDELNATTTQLAKLELDGPGQTALGDFRKQIAALEEQKEKLESEISRRSAEFSAQTQPVTLAAVQAAIPRGAALIEFTTYRPFNPQEDNLHAYGEPRYIAYAVLQQGDVKWKDFGPAKEIDAAIEGFRNGLRDPNRKDVSRLARALDERVMQPVRGLLGEATELLISPDGELNLVPFAALVDERGHYLIERYSVNYLTTGRDLLRMQVARQSQSPAVVVADPVFGDPPLLAERETSHRDGGTKASGSARIDYSRVFFGPLPGVNDEVRALRELLPNGKFLTREQATKAALQSVVAPSVLHIATHGFFLSEPGEVVGATGSAPGTTRGISANAKIENPLLRSGLALAGANRKDESGIMTALEASGLNLWGTKLVVLSACDTGLGQVRNGEGVYGLRRAFVLAGAQTQLMSLWPVSDRATRDLMIGYYKDLVNGYGRGEALRRAQLQMLHSKSHGHPYYWAGFIQTGEWANLEGNR